jgi:hypothetical protein
MRRKRRKRRFAADLRGPMKRERASRKLASALFLVICLAPDSYRADACPECGPGERKAVATIIVPPSAYVSSQNPPCADPQMNERGLSPDTAEMLAKLYVTAGPGRHGLAWANEDLERVMRERGGPGSGMRRRQYFSSAAERGGFASCGLLVVLLPLGSNMTRHRHEPCEFCDVSPPKTNRYGEGVQVVTALFKNLSHNTENRGIMTVYYR